MAEQSLVKKLAQVMAEVPRIPKRGRNKFFGYDYATEADVADKVREALAKQNVVMIPSLAEHSMREITTSKGNKETVAMVVMEYTFHDGDTGETISFKMPGEGQDPGDKAFYKAITGSGKYAMMKAFLIPTGDDPENDGDDKGDDKKDDKTNGKTTPASTPTTTPAGDSEDPADLRKTIGNMILEMSGNDKNLAGDLLEKYTAYKKDDKEYPGKRSLRDVSDKALGPTLRRVRVAYEAWQANTGRLIA